MAGDLAKRHVPIPDTPGVEEGGIDEAAVPCALKQLPPEAEWPVQSRPREEEGRGKPCPTKGRRGVREVGGQVIVEGDRDRHAPTTRPRCRSFGEA